MDPGAALHLSIFARIVALQDAKDRCGEGIGSRWARLLQHSGVRRKDRFGTGDFCDLRDDGRDRGLTMSFIRFHDWGFFLLSRSS